MQGLMKERQSIDDDTGDNDQPLGVQPVKA
jgi:hypothetical protein